MNLLEKFEAVTVKADGRITPEDKAFCEVHQAAYDAAVQSFRELAFFWEDMENTQKELLGGEGAYYLSSHNGPEISRRRINDHLEYLHREVICNIVRHFNTTYNVSVSSGDICNNLLPKEPGFSSYDNMEVFEEYHNKLREAKVRYEDVVDQIILLLDGRSFAQQAFFELTEKCHKAAWNLHQKEAEFERKKSTIRFTGYFCHVNQGYRQEEWKLNDKTKEILHGVAHFETGAYDIYPLGFSELLRYGGVCYNEHEFTTCKKVVSLKMFKNGRVDLKFATDAYAEAFINTYLGAVC